MPSKKRKVGRPTLYKPEYCQMLIDHMNGGGSYEGFGGVIGVSKQTMYDWEKTFPEFVDAKKKALAASRHFWDGVGFKLITGQYKGSATPWAMIMKNMHRFKDNPDADPEEYDAMAFENGCD